MDKRDSGKQTFVVAYWYGEYDDFKESILGVTDNYEEALSYAKKMASLINNQESWHFYEDSIVVKKFIINRCLVDSKLIHSDDWMGGYGPRTLPFKQKYLWKLDGSEKKLVNVENKSKWEEW